MRVRSLCRVRKHLQSDTGWQRSDLPPRHDPLISRTKPIRGFWQWRSAKAASADCRNFVLVALCNSAKGNWKSHLLIATPSGHSVVARFEHHSSHGGLHIHAHCDRGGVDIGPTGMDNLSRVPRIGRERRNVAWTETTFWQAALRFYRIEEPLGPLFDDHGAA